jgi:hypothetical protein
VALGAILDALFLEYAGRHVGRRWAAIAVVIRASAKSRLLGTNGREARPAKSVLRRG